MQNLTYLTDADGQALAVVIPIDLWRKLLPGETVSPEELSEAIEDYCLNSAMDEGKQSPLLNRAEALAALDED